VKKYWVSREEFLDSFIIPQDCKEENLRITKWFPLLPIDCKVLEVHTTYDPPGFVFILTSEHWPEVFTTEPIPEIEKTVEEVYKHWYKIAWKPEVEIKEPYLFTVKDFIQRLLELPIDSVLLTEESRIGTMLRVRINNQWVLIKAMLEEK